MQGRLITASGNNEGQDMGVLEILYPYVRDIPVRKVSAVVNCLIAPDHVVKGGVSFVVSGELLDPAVRRVYMTSHAWSKLKNTFSFDPTYWEES